MQPGDRLLLGTDLIKETPVIEKAYNDASGTTARFNINILNVVNSLLGSDFCTDDFEHDAFFNPEHSRMEMHLRATKEMKVVIPGETDPVTLEEGETIHTENSHKFSPEDLQHFSSKANLNLETIHTDPNRWFAVSEMTK